MTKELDLADIQGNIIRAYGRFGYPKARYFFLNIRNARAAWRFINTIFPLVTPAIRWHSPGSDYPGEERIEQPDVTLNIGFSYAGLEAMQLSTRTLHAMPSEFIDGMGKRSHILSDVDESAAKNWDPIWRNNHGDTAVHIWISMNALVDRGSLGAEKIEMTGDLEARTKWLEDLVASFPYEDEMGKSLPGVVILSGHNKKGARYQEASAIIHETENGEVITAEEHFGYRDGIGDPVFEGQFAADVENERVKGRGKIMPDGQWAPLATGEFLLGHPDEAQEIPGSALPPEFSQNGTFMAYRKLQEHVHRFDDYIEQSAKKLAAIMEIDETEARNTIKAKMIGRWPDGTPLVKAATETERRKFRELFERDLEIAHAALAIEIKDDNKERATAIRTRIAAIKQRETDFKYADDFDGIKCPYASHLRRGNARDMHDPKVAAGPGEDGKPPVAGNGSALNRRRRIMRRGLPYEEKGKTGADKGIIFMALCSSLFRQFEFLQQQWMQYGLDFQTGNDTCPIIGQRHKEFGSKFVIPVDPKGNKPPFICAELPPFVTTKGGEYFFLPSITALRMIAMGIIDPT